jgi:hypothetical protein
MRRSIDDPDWPETFQPCNDAYCLPAGTDIVAVQNRYSGSRHACAAVNGVMLCCSHVAFLVEGGSTTDLLAGRAKRVWVRPRLRPLPAGIDLSNEYLKLDDFDQLFVGAFVPIDPATGHAL